MDVMHEGGLISLYPAWPPVFSKADTTITLRRGSSTDEIYIKMPPIFANAEAIASTTYCLRHYCSLYWNDEVYCNLRIRSGKKTKSVGYIYPLGVLANRRSKLAQMCDDNSTGSAQATESTVEETRDGTSAISAMPSAETQVQSVFDAKGVASEFEKGHALAAIHELLKGSDAQIFGIPEISWGASYTLTDFYHENLVLGIYVPSRIDNDAATAEALITEFEMAFADLRTYPLVETKLRKHLGPPPPHQISHILLEQCRTETQRRIFLYVRKHLLSLEAHSSDPLIRFFLQYQLFELLMQEVFTQVIDGFRTQVALPVYSDSAWRTKDLIKKLNEKSAETYRIGRIFSFLAPLYPTEIDEIASACKTFIDEIVASGKGDPSLKDISGAAELYYKVRNIIFHGYSSNEISQEPIALICEKIGRLIFKIPYIFDDTRPCFE